MTEAFFQAVKTGDTVTIERECDIIFNYFENIDNDEKWKYLNMQMKKKNITIKKPRCFYGIQKLEDLLVEYDVDSEYLEPFNISKIPIKDKFKFDYIFPKISVLNGFTKCWNTIIMFHLIYGDAMLKSDITQAFVWYLNLFKHEPFIENGDGSIVLDSTCIDAAVSLRVKLFIRCIQEEMMGKIERTILYEMFYYLFKNPQRNTSNVKKFKGNILNCAFCESNSGIILAWINNELSDYICEDPPNINMDSTTTIRLKKEIREDYDELVKMGLPIFAKRIWDMISEPIIYENVSDYSILWFIEALSGFLRGNYPNVTIKSITDSSKNRFYRPKNRIKDHLFNLWYEALEGWIREMPETEEEYILEMYSDLTTRSNGLNDYKITGGEWKMKDVNGIKIPYNEGGEYIENEDVVKMTINTDLEGHHRMKWDVKDKALTFRHRPKDYLDPKKMAKSLSKEDPGRMFYRQVAARQTRLVYGLPLYRFLAERETRSITTFLSNIKYNGQETSTVQNDTGRYLTEHGQKLKITGHPELNMKILLADFSQFDQTQVFENFRTVMIGAAKKLRNDYSTELVKYKFPVLNGMTPLDALILNWETMDDAYFSIYLSKNEFVLLPVGWLLSGEFATLVSNTFTNMAFMMQVIDELPITYFEFEGKRLCLSDYITIENYKLQGDDQIASIQYRHIMTIDFMVAMETRFIDLMYDVATSAGLVLAKTKTELRQGRFEFLKKSGIYGYAVPRYLQINQNESENINRTLDAIERMASRVSFLRESIFRGCDYMSTVYRIYIEWTLISAIKIRKPKNKETGKFEPEQTIRLPFSIIWTPLSEGGVGLLPNNIVDPNNDVMIALHDWDKLTRHKINACIRALRSRTKKNSDLIVKQVMNKMSEGTDYEKYLDNSVMQDKIKLSMSAMHELKKEYNLPEDASAYYNRYSEEIREAIEDNPKMDRINAAWKMRNSIEIAKAYNLDSCDDYLSQMFIPGVSFQLGDVMPIKFPICPVVGLDSILQEWFIQMGTSSEDNLITRDNYKSVANLLNKGNFPRNLKANNPEAIARSLLKYNIVTSTGIANFFLMRGADPEAAILAGSVMEKNIDMLQYLSNINGFSFNGEGMTDKSIKRITEVATFDNLILDNLSPFSRVILAAGYQYCRTQPLIDGNGEYNPRRFVRISITNETIKQYLIKGFNAATLSVLDSDSIKSYFDLVFQDVSFSLLIN